MAKTVADPHVLQATNQPNMLQNLEEANGLLDEIMKGIWIIGGAWITTLLLEISWQNDNLILNSCIVLS